MMLSPELREELLELADLHVEDQLDETARTRLDRLVANDKAAAELFVRFTQFSSLLERRNTELVPEAEEFKYDVDKPVSLPRAVLRYIGQPFRISLVIAGLAITIGLLSMALVRVTFGPRENNDKPIASAADYVGRFTRLADCRWSSATVEALEAEPVRDDDIPRGKVIELLAGDFDLVLDSGTKLRVTGPAALRCLDDNEIEFLHGEATAYIPPRAVGFALHAAGATLIDLGTEFGVRVDPLGAAEAHVFRGAIAVELPRADGTQSEPIRLNEYQALRWQRDGSAPSEPLAAHMASFPRWQPGVEVPSQFIADSANAEPESALPYTPAADDLLHGLVPVVSFNSHVSSTLPMLTDGRGSDPLRRGVDGRVMIGDGTGTQFSLTYDLGLAEGQTVSIEQLRVFSYNTDSRVFVDCDLEGSLDGEQWFTLHNRLTNGRRGVEFNRASGTEPDYYYDYAVAWLEPRDEAPPVRHVRLTFRGVFGGADFASRPTNMHSALTEIDLLGDVIRPDDVN